jgi:hypothetical protein
MQDEHPTFCQPWSQGNTGAGTEQVAAVPWLQVAAFKP